MFEKDLNKSQNDENDTSNKITIYKDYKNKEQINSDNNRNNIRVGSEANLSTKNDEINQNKKNLAKIFIIIASVVVVVVAIVLIYVFVLKNDDSNNSDDNNNNENLGDNSN
jgi:hypothetical protein